MIISIQYLYWLAGVLLLITAGMILLDRSHPKRWSSALFWLLFAVPFLVGERLPSVVIGVGVVVMALIAGLGGVGRGQHAELHDKASRASAGRLGHKLFIPALAIPLTTVIGSVLLKHTEIGGVPLLDPKNTTFVSLGIGCLIALGLACWLTRDTPVQALRESRRLTEALGWAMVLPQMLAMLGLLFNEAGVGTAVAHVTTTYINLDYKLVAVMVYVLGGYQSDFARNWAREGLSIGDGFVETVRQGLDATRLDADEMESGHVGNFVGDLFAGQGLLGSRQCMFVYENLGTQNHGGLLKVSRSWTMRRAVYYVRWSACGRQG